MPWDIYYASHARIVLNGASPKPGDEGFDPAVAARQEYSVKQLKRTELISLGATMVVPLVGSCLLYYARGLLSDPDRYINRFLISLFAIATSVKPFLHFSRLVKHSESNCPLFQVRDTALSYAALDRLALSPRASVVPVQ